jgi:hypothetical protein
MALLGMVFYATLLSWHFAYRALQGTGIVVTQTLNPVMCHAGSGPAELPDNPTPSKTDCPLCSGLSPPHAVVHPEMVSLTLQTPSGIYGRIAQSTTAIAALLDGPRSRDPPRLLLI